MIRDVAGDLKSSLGFCVMAFRPGRSSGDIVQIVAVALPILVML
jgi:hypothetical protein